MNSKTVSLKDKKLISEKLRNENKKMEVRLQQLKLTMSKEKEDRLLSGNSSMWSTGAPGAVLNYKPNLTTLDKSKKIKLKILKEEDEIMTHDSKGQLQTQHRMQPFNGDVLSSRGDNVGRDALYSREDHSTGKKKCGQCEETFASVNCKECTEIYCAKCFAAFHLKGALRKHRSTPISNISNRVSIPSPLFKPPDFSNLSNNSSRDNKESAKSHRAKNDISHDTTRKPFERQHDYKENQSPNHNEISLADGDYDEAMSTQYFQDALTAWRRGEEAPYKPSPPPTRPTIEHSTETLSGEADKRLIGETIHFTPSLSYAEKLLLRKHRSCQLAPVDMKFILNRLSKNSEFELLENQRLLQSNLILETSAINETIVNGPLAVNRHEGIGSLTDLWSEVSHLTGRNSRNNIETIPDLDLQVNDVLSTTNTNKEGPVFESKTVLTSSQSYKLNDTAPSKIIQSVENGKDYKEESIISKPLEEISKLKLSSRRPNSAMNRNNFNDRPQSARRMSARHDKGGKISTQPSVLLKILASFNEYLPVNNKDQDDNRSIVNSSVRFNSAGSSRPTTKLNYNFYKIAPQSWKPSQAWSDKPDEINPQNELQPESLAEGTATTNDEYDEELGKLDFFANNSSSPQFVDTVILDRLSPSNSDVSDENLLSNVDVDCLDKEGEEEQCLELLETYERELTLISRKDTETNNGGDYDELVADSLDLQNFSDSLDVLESDKFHFEDSLDFQQRISHNSRPVIDESDDDLRNCSSRFNDYDDVHNLN